MVDRQMFDPPQPQGSPLESLIIARERLLEPVKIDPVGTSAQESETAQLVASMLEKYDLEKNKKLYDFVDEAESWINRHAHSIPALPQGGPYVSCGEEGTLDPVRLWYRPTSFERVPNRASEILSSPAGQGYLSIDQGDGQLGPRGFFGAPAPQWAYAGPVQSRTGGRIRASCEDYVHTLMAVVRPSDTPGVILCTKSSASTGQEPLPPNPNAELRIEVAGGVISFKFVRDRAGVEVQTPFRYSSHQWYVVVGTHTPDMSYVMVNGRDTYFGSPFVPADSLMWDKAFGLGCTWGNFVEPTEVPDGSYIAEFMAFRQAQTLEQAEALSLARLEEAELV